MAKGPKFLNPADKARKEARKKELKKNKKQRQQIRSAAIESKDPEQVIADLEKLDGFEFDADANLSMGDSFYKDKRKRLKETWARILVYYQKEDPERHAKLKKLEQEYEVKHKKVSKEFEGIKAALELKIEDVFLPADSNSDLDEIAEDDPLMSESVFVTPLTEGVKPPGCPPGLPPDFKDIVDSLKSSLDLSSQIDSVVQMANYEATQCAISGLNLAKMNSIRPKNDSKRRQHPYRRELKQTQSDNKLTAVTSSNPPSKATVIESKPVIFIPKATTFVPASVRRKQNKIDPKN